MAIDRCVGRVSLTNKKKGEEEEVEAKAEAEGKGDEKKVSRFRTLAIGQKATSRDWKK